MIPLTSLGCRHVLVNLAVDESHQGIITRRNSAPFRRAASRESQAL